MLIKVALKLNSTFTSTVRNGSCHLKNRSAKPLETQFKKINYLFPMVQEL
jgi:hypothetical protein